MKKKTNFSVNFFPAEDFSTKKEVKTQTEITSNSNLVHERPEKTVQTKSTAIRLKSRKTQNVKYKKTNAGGNSPRSSLPKNENIRCKLLSSEVVQSQKKEAAQHKTQFQKSFAGSMREMTR